MKKLITLFIVASLALTIQAQNITNTPGSGGDFIITSTTGGILIPKLTKTQRDAITGHVAGLMIYQTDNTPGFYYYNGSAWVTIGTLVGINDLSDGISSHSSVFLGLNAGGTSSTGAGNVATGLDAMAINEGGGGNSAYGFEALNSNVGGFDNTALGYQSLDGNQGSDNIAIGSMSASTSTTGSYNIIIGTEGTNASTAAADNELNIGNLIYGTDVYEDTGKVGIGKGNHAPTSTLDVLGSMSLPIRNESANYTATATDYTIVFDGGLNQTLSLPTAVGIPGRVYVVKYLDGGVTFTLTIDPDGSETIDGLSSDVLNGTGSYIIQSTGAGWIILAEF